MSAIFGLISKIGKPVEGKLFDRMQNSFLSKAVDGCDLYLEGNVMLGHQKLIVHRKQRLEKQPLMVDEYVIVCDARIDNFDQLLQVLDLPFSDKNLSDSFIILQAYKKWGKKCVHYFEGEFCFAIWNNSKQMLFNACDHIGFRTFYFYENENFFTFSSDIKAIEEIKTESLNINDEIFIDIYSNKLRPHTYDKNIKVLPSAHYLELNQHGKLTIVRYWRLTEDRKYNFKTPEDWHSCLLRLMSNKIERQIDSDFPIGVLLSGGLDSSFVAAIACNLLKKEGRKLHAFCSVLPETYKGENKDERFFISELQKQFDNLEVHFIALSPEKGPYTDLDIVFDQTGTPTNVFHYVDIALYKAAKEQGVRTILTGFGGDMTISINVADEVYQNLLSGDFMKAIKSFQKKLVLTDENIFTLLRKEIICPIPLYQRVRERNANRKNSECLPLNKEFQQRKQKAELKYYVNDKKRFRKFVNEGEIGFRLFIMRKLTMAYQEELCCPILSKDVAELFINTPTQVLMLNGNSRSFIKEAMKQIVPDVIVNRKDKGNYSPDFDIRISKIDQIKNYKLSVQESLLNRYTGIVFSKFTDVANKLNEESIENKWNNEFLYLPITFQSIKFFEWLAKKSKSVRKNSTHSDES